MSVYREEYAIAYIDQRWLVVVRNIYADLPKWTVYAEAPTDFVARDIAAALNAEANR